ncbi:LuxR C-terminal-related transcriptional regulator [Pseudonocardia xishanensis]|uniref:LuxR C-terminal-related transcriptional regulator n=1 Tax=Pseudonocardia xishanensis TaxID=630995 RepID=A0ABP8RXU2_9PSEU
MRSHTVVVQSAPDHPPTRGVPSAADSIQRALGRVRRETGSSLAFGGRVEESGVLLAHFDGSVVGPLRGVRLAAGHGLGGRVVAQERPLAVRDYVEDPLITHRYDAIIRAERLRAFAAVPVIVGRRPVAVLYASQRAPQENLDRVLDVVTREARALEQELVVTDLLRRLAPDGHGPVDLTRRERDVLTLLAAGMSDRAAAETLGIGLYTVKGHVKSLLAKLHATNRLEAVVTARRQNLLP